MRMESLNRPSGNALQERTSKTWRPAFRMLSWQTTGRYAKSSTKDHAVLAFLSQDQVTNNTTRGSIPGLVNPFLGEADGRVPLPAMKLGEGLSRSQVARLRAEQQRKQLQDMEPDFTSESLSHDPSEEVVDNDAAQGFPGKAKSLAHTAENSSQENMIATWPPGIQSRYVSTKHPYPCHRPSTHHIIGNSSNQALLAKDHALSVAENQNGFCGSSSLHSTLHTSRTKRQHENKSQEIEHEHRVVKKRLVASARLAKTSISKNSTALQPYGLTLTEPWISPSQNQPSTIPGVSALVPYPLNRQSPILDSLPTYPAPLARMACEPDRTKETGRSQMPSITDVVVSSGLISILVSQDRIRTCKENVMAGYNHLGQFGRNLGYQEPGQESAAL